MAEVFEVEVVSAKPISLDDIIAVLSKFDVKSCSLAVVDDWNYKNRQSIEIGQISIADKLIEDGKIVIVSDSCGGAFVWKNNERYECSLWLSNAQFNLLSAVGEKSKVQTEAYIRDSLLDDFVDNSIVYIALGFEMLIAEDDDIFDKIRNSANVDMLAVTAPYDVFENNTAYAREVRNDFVIYKRKMFSVQEITRGESTALKFDVVLGEYATYNRFYKIEIANEVGTINIGLQEGYFGIEPQIEVVCNKIFIAAGTNLYVVNAADKTQRKFELECPVYCIYRTNAILVVVGELYVIGFTFSGERIWNRDFDSIVVQNEMVDNQLKIVTDDGEKLTLDVANGAIE